jgi:hypothetical protein
MLKIVGRILLVVLIAALLSASVYFIFNGGSTQSAPTLDQGNPSASGQGSALNGTGNGQGQHRGEDASGNSGAAWLDLLKNLGIIAVITAAVALIQKVMSASSQGKIMVKTN